uniref:Uncharacterized protein n=1 Tax=Parascaris univalens TaxID=6257 RepID=A0A914ZP15_PARUN
MLLTFCSFGLPSKNLFSWPFVATPIKFKSVRYKPRYGIQGSFIESRCCLKRSQLRSLSNSRAVFSNTERS